MIKNVCIIGGGVLGSQIAFQTAYCGYNVTLLVVAVDDPLKERLDNLYKEYKKAIEEMKNPNEFSTWYKGIAEVGKFNEKECLEKLEKAKNGIILSTDQAESLKDADLVIESITLSHIITNKL